MIKDTRFLMCVDSESKELYILHREYPRCLIYVEQTTPINFVVLDYFEENAEEGVKQLIQPSFKQDLKDYFYSQSFNLKDQN